MTLIQLYQSLGADGINGQHCQSLLTQTHWFTINADFDPKTGEALPQALSAFLAKIGGPATAGTLHDRLWRIMEHARPSVQRLFRALNESPRREQALLPVRAVRELDANSFIKLSNRPGRNIREKLAGNPYLQAVRRFQSINVPENRLLKAFATRLAELLELRQDCLGQEEELLPQLQSWLLSAEARAIARWDNVPPNNTLLSHRDYRRVWDAWRWLQTLDDDITRDFAQLEVRAETVRVWNEYGLMYCNGRHLFAEMPVLFNYETFEIRPWFSQLAIQKKEIHRFFGKRITSGPVCVDLTDLRPHYAAVNGVSTLGENYLWQQWQRAGESVDIELFKADAAYLHSDATSIASADLFFSNDNTPDHLDRAARAFACKLRELFTNDTIIWLVPDFLNDFELEVIRCNLNARFPGAEPLPRSVAALFEQVDYGRITNDGYPVIVVDTVGGITCATKMLARFDPDLKNRLPETNGYYWERCPPVILFRRDAGEERRYNMVTFDGGNGKWHDSALPERSQFIDPNLLKDDPRIGKFAFCITLSHSPVAGGMRLHALQTRAGDIPLWRDQIPELSIKVMKDGRPHRFYVVSRGTTIKPVRGLSVQIPIEERFTLPAGRRFYQFPLSQGENAAELRFSARLDSPAFPLISNTECELILTFQYGDDEPYTLMFAPLDESFPPVRATWQRTVEDIVTDAPAPEYPPPMSWEDLRRWRDPQGNEVDLLAWLIDSLERLIELTPRRRMISISSSWIAKTDKDGKKYWFTFAKTEDRQECYCNSKSLFTRMDEDPNAEFPRGTELYGNIAQTQRGLAAFDISRERTVCASVEAKQRILSFRARSLQNRMSTIWADGRSLTDATCPSGFKRKCDTLIAALMETLPSDIIERKMMFLLACLHRDTVDKCVQWVTDQVEGGHVRDPRAVGFALGDVSQDWQQYVFDRFASNPGSDAMSAFAYAIWRERHLVERFTLSELNALLNALLQRLANIRPVGIGSDRDTDRWTLRNWTRATAESLELLLGLLRIRASDNPDIRMLLQPHQRITKRFAEQIDRIEDMTANMHINLFSRVQINIKKPEGVRTPDLLYALRLYLTGDDGANAIHITGISDTDED